MNGMTDIGLPPEIARALGISWGERDQFEETLNAFARYHRRPSPPTREQIARAEKLAKAKNPLHIKAVERRRKHKRGGPK